MPSRSICHSDAYDIHLHVPKGYIPILFSSRHYPQHEIHPNLGFGAGYKIVKALKIKFSFI